METSQNPDPRTPRIACGCGHALKMHCEHGFAPGPCRHPQCDCDEWDWSSSNSDAEFAPFDHLLKETRQGRPRNRYYKG